MGIKLQFFKLQLFYLSRIRLTLSLKSNYHCLYKLGSYAHIFQANIINYFVGKKDTEKEESPKNVEKKKTGSFFTKIETNTEYVYCNLWLDIKLVVFFVQMLVIMYISVKGNVNDLWIRKNYWEKAFY